MNRLCAALTGAGVGMGLMYLLDPTMGRRRRALLRDKFVSMGHTIEDAAQVVGHDMRNRAQGLASGDLSVLAGGKRALEHPLQGGWSPAGRTVMAGLGAGLFLAGLTRSAPTACILGTMGLALVAEGLTNVGVRDIADSAGNLVDKARHLLGGAAKKKAPAAEKQSRRPQPVHA